MNCPCGTETRKAFSGIASAGAEYDYCPHCKEDVTYLNANPDKVKAIGVFSAQLHPFVTAGYAYGRWSVQNNIHPTLKAFGTDKFIVFKAALGLGLPIGTVVDLNVFRGHLSPTTYAELCTFGLHPCDGSAFSAMTRPDLFNIIGYKYGIHPYSGLPLVPDASVLVTTP